MLGSDQTISSGYYPASGLYGPSDVSSSSTKDNDNQKYSFHQILLMYIMYTVNDYLVDEI